MSELLFIVDNYLPRRPWFPALGETPGYCHTLPPPQFNFYQHQALGWSRNFIDSPGIYYLEILQGNSLGFLHTDVTMEY